MVYAGYSIQKNILLFYQNQRNDKKNQVGQKKEAYSPLSRYVSLVSLAREDYKDMAFF